VIAMTWAVVAPAQLVVWGSEDGTRPSNLGDVIQISMSYHHAAALKADGTVVCWGDNNWGQCNVPPDLKDVVQISAGWSDTLALKKDGTVVAWGYSDEPMPSGLTDVVQVAASYFTNFALKRDGTVVYWGLHMKRDPHTGTPLLKDPMLVPAGLKNVIKIAAGSWNCLALKKDGTVVAWGFNDKGVSNVTVGLKNVVDIAVGYTSGMALLKNGKVICWGTNDSGVLNVPPGLEGVVQISAYEQHVLALREDGTVVAWGRNYEKQCDVPANLSGVGQISAGYYASAALRTIGLSFAAPSIKVGDQVKGTVTLTRKYSTAMEVTLSSSDPTLLLPERVTIPAGKQSADFTATAEGPLPSDIPIKVRASFGYGAAVASVMVTAIGATLDLSTYSLVGGSDTVVTGKIILSSALMKDTSLELSSDDPSISVPRSVDTRTGEKSVTFEIAHSMTPTKKAVTISVSQAGVVLATKKINLDVLTPKLKLNPASVNAGESSVATVTLNAKVGAATKVALATDQPSSVTLPATVTIPAHSSSATAKLTTATAGSPSAEIKATVNGQTVIANLAIVKLEASLTPSVATVVGGSTAEVTATIQLKSAQAKTTTFRLKSSDLVALAVPDSVTVKAGEKSVTFNAYHTMRVAKKVVTISALVGGSSLASTQVTILPMRATLLLKPAAVIGGQTAVATLTLNAPTASALDVALSADHTALITLPPSVQVPIHASSATASIPTTFVSKATKVTVTAKANGASSTAALTLAASRKLKAFQITSDTVGDTDLLGAVTLDAVVKADQTVTVVSTDPAVHVAPVIVPAGKLTADFAFVMDDVETAKTVTLTATAGPASLTKTITIRPMGPSELTLSASRVKRGESLTGTVKFPLPGKSPSKAITLTSDDSTAIVPATVSLAGGQVEVSFKIRTVRGKNPRWVTITASRNGISVTARFQLVP